MPGGVATFQEWSARTGKNPFLLAYENRNVDPDDAQALANDASTCLLIAEGLPGGIEAPGFDMWEEAEEFHAFAVMVVKPRVLRAMEWPKAQSLASAAARQAQAALDDPGLRLPEFAGDAYPSHPRSVLAAVRLALPNGPLPRRMAAAKEAAALAPAEPGAGAARAATG